MQVGVRLKRDGHRTASPFGIFSQANLLLVWEIGSWPHWDWSGGIQLEGSREQSWPAPGHCAQEFENAAILSLVTFIPLPSAPTCLTKAHMLLSSTSGGARKLSSGFTPFALVSFQVGGGYMCCSVVFAALINLLLNS